MSSTLLSSDNISYGCSDMRLAIPNSEERSLSIVDDRYETEIDPDRLRGFGIYELIHRFHFKKVVEGSTYDQQRIIDHIEVLFDKADSNISTPIGYQWKIDTTLINRDHFNGCIGDRQSCYTYPSTIDYRLTSNQDVFSTGYSCTSALENIPLVYETLAEDTRLYQQNKQVLMQLENVNYYSNNIRYSGYLGRVPILEEYYLKP